MKQVVCGGVFSPSPKKVYRVFKSGDRWGTDRVGTFSAHTIASAVKLASLAWNVPPRTLTASIDIERSFPDLLACGFSIATTIACDLHTYFTIVADNRVVADHCGLLLVERLNEWCHERTLMARR